MCSKEGNKIENCMPFRYASLLFRTAFSPARMVHCFFKWGYELFENVNWRKKIHAGKSIRVHPTASIRNPQNVYIGDHSHINLNCCVWAGKTSKIVLGKFCQQDTREFDGVGNTHEIAPQTATGAPR